jgi:hypothetical protein
MQLQFPHKLCSFNAILFIEQRAVTSLDSSNKLVFVEDKQCAVFVVEVIISASRETSDLKDLYLKTTTAHKKSCTLLVSTVLRSTHMQTEF